MGFDPFVVIFHRDGRERVQVGVEAGEGCSRHGGQDDADHTTGKPYTSQPLPPFMQELLADGGLMAHVIKKIGVQNR